jgi:ribonuclease BN (tRNA processing enzyme)
MDISTQFEMNDDNNSSNESSAEIIPLRWRSEMSFNDYMFVIHTNKLFVIDHFDIAINEIKLKHIEELKNFLLNGHNRLAKMNMTKVQLLRLLKSLVMKHCEQIESFLILNEIKHRSQYMENHESCKSLTYSKYELLEMDVDNKNKMVINSNLIKLAVEETIIQHKLKEAMDHWNSGATIE